MRPSTRRLLATLRAEHGEAVVRALVDDIRASPDAAVRAARAPPPARPADPAVVAVTALLAPFSAKSGEKARMLAAHLEKLVGRPLPVRARGLPATVRALRAHLSDDDIRDGAFSLRVTLQGAKAYRNQTDQDDPHES
jgi:hypothetical protein